MSDLDADSWTVFSVQLVTDVLNTQFYFQGLEIIFKQPFTGDSHLSGPQQLHR